MSMRCLSYLQADGTIVFRAGATGPVTLPDFELRERCHSAPPEIRSMIDSGRRARGLRPLWSDEERRQPRPARDTRPLTREAVRQTIRSLRWWLARQTDVTRRA